MSSDAIDVDAGVRVPRPEQFRRDVASRSGGRSSRLPRQSGRLCTPRSAQFLDGQPLVTADEETGNMPGSAASHWRCAALFTVFAVVNCAAQPTAPSRDYFRGKTIKLNIATGTGGAYGAYALVFAQYFGRHIPGEPAVVPEYRPGAGGVVAANYLYNVAPKDGTVIGMPLAPIVLGAVHRRECAIRCVQIPLDRTDGRHHAAVRGMGNVADQDVRGPDDARVDRRHHRPGFRNLHESGADEPRVRHQDQDRQRLQGLERPDAGARAR